MLPLHCPSFGGRASDLATRNARDLRLKLVAGSEYAGSSPLNSRFDSLLGKGRRLLVVVVAWSGHLSYMWREVSYVMYLGI